MTGRHHATFFLPDGLRQSARAGEHNFIGKIEKVVREAGMSVAFRDPDETRRDDDGYSLFHMLTPPNERGVTIRRAYYYPFWQIEQTNERWHWDVARTPFDPTKVEPVEAQRFYRFWQKRLYERALSTLGNDGFVYAPLQGRIRDHRSFQTCSPIDMLRQVLDLVPDRNVIASLHPKEFYSEADFAALERLEANCDRLELRMGEMETLLPRCAYVVTQNSSVAFAGYFFGKPSVLFGRIDFHHIAANVSELGAKAALEIVEGLRPDYAAYVWWFLQHMSINAGRGEAEDRIRSRLKRFGWPV